MSDKMYSAWLCVFLLWVFNNGVSFGQYAIKQPASEVENIVQQALGQEAVQLHHSQLYYASGERVWYKAYLRVAKAQEASKVLHVSLCNSSGQRIVEQCLIVQDGMAIGDFLLPRELPTGYYTLTAGTNWLRNFSKPQQHHEKILVVNAKEVLALKDTAFQSKSKVLHVKFSPEGHTLLVGMPTKMAVTVTNTAGMGVTTTGFVEDEAGIRVADFTTGPSGLSSFLLTPQEGKRYFAQIKDAGNTTLRLALPPAIVTGSSLVIDERSIAGIKVRLRSTQPDEHTLVAVAGNNVYFTQTTTLPNLSKVVTVPWDTIQGGVVKLFLLNNKKQVVAERVVSPLTAKSLVLKTDIEKYKPRQEVKVTLQTNDFEKQIIPTQLSVTVLQLPPEPTSDNGTAITDEQMISTLPDSVLWQAINSGPAPIKFMRETFAKAITDPESNTTEAAATLNYRTDTMFVQLLPADVKAYALQAHIRKQINAAYGNMEPHALSSSPRLPVDRVFKLDDYIEFNNMTEAIRGATTNVRLSKRKGKYSLYLLYTNEMDKYFYKEEPLYIIDDVVVNSTDELIKLKVSDLASFEIAWQEATLNATNIGERVENGIFAVYTKSREAGARLRAQGFPILYGIYTLPHHFVTVRYHGDAAIPTNIPNIKSLVFWKPFLEPDTNGEVNFFFNLPDNSGDFKIIVRGFTQDGEPLKETKTILSVN